MFSGIVQGTGKISKIISKKNHITLEISAPKNFNKNLKKGASVSVNGICLTSLDNGKKNLKFDVINETLSKTNIGKARKGSLVNLERSITQIKFPKKYRQYIFEKGYIGVNGCSLTLGKVNNDSFYVHLIPETLKITNLSDLKKGSFVNIEIDQNTIAIVETVKNSLAAQKS